MPVLEQALEQHARYCEALEHCGLAITRLDADARFPDSTFVEDTAVLTPRRTILTLPGAPSRVGEVAGVRSTLERLRGSVRDIQAPGTLDGGDVCETDQHYFIGISERTNAEGARQLAAFLAEDGYRSTCVDIRGIDGLLHLKSGIAYLGDRRLLAIERLADLEAFREYRVLPVDRAETYAANCVRVNRHVLLAAGYPGLEASLRREGYSLLPLEMSEFRKMDGGLSCLSLRF
jgi:dimethylargininase